jgi:hypothetical protein
VRYLRGGFRRTLTITVPAYQPPGGAVPHTADS